MALIESIYNKMELGDGRRPQYGRHNVRFPKEPVLNIISRNNSTMRKKKKTEIERMKVSETTNNQA